jgi:hypothetical protein
MPNQACLRNDCIPEVVSALPLLVEIVGQTIVLSSVADEPQIVNHMARMRPLIRGDVVLQ